MNLFCKSTVLPLPFAIKVVPQVMLLFFLLGMNLKTMAQQGDNQKTTKPIRHQIGLRHDNDLILLTDRYYTSGLFLTYRHRLKNGFLYSDNEQLSFSLRQEIITPRYLSTHIIEQLDRAYVGFMALKAGWSRVRDKSLVETDFLLGIAGEASGAGAFQRWYHDTVLFSQSPTWVGEMENSVHYNLYANYLYEWQLAPNPFSIYMAVKPQMAFGTRDIYLHPEMVLYLGRRNPLSSSIAHHQIGSKEQELFFALRTGYRLVGYNGLLQGNALGDDSVLLMPPKKTVLFAGCDFQHRHGQNEYWVGVRYNTAESNKAKAHKYVILSYTRNF